MTIETVSDLFVETLQQAGVQRIYGVVGDSLNGITESIRARGKIDWVHVRHEEVAAFAAGADEAGPGEWAQTIAEGTAMTNDRNENTMLT